MDALSTVNTRRTPQQQPATPTQQRNNAGGYTFTLDDMARLRRFLTLGVEGGTYYATGRELAADNAAVVKRLAQTDPAGLVAAIVDVSTRGAAPKVQPAIFGLAYAASVPTARPLVEAAFDDVIRTGSHLLTFVRYYTQNAGWSRSMRRTVGGWYLRHTPEDVAYQVAKYRQRDGWAQRDVLRLTKPRITDPTARAVAAWVTRGTVTPDAPKVLTGHAHANNPDAIEADWLDAIDDGLSWEMLPSTALTSPAVWRHLIHRDQLPLGAMIRQLPRLTNLRVIGASDSDVTRLVVDRLRDPDRIKRSRIHPMNVLVALRTYASGVSDRGSSTWTPAPSVVDALNDAFYAAFGNVEPARKRTLVALDVSGSMTWDRIAGMNLDAREASAAMALVTVATEPDTHVVGFTSGTGMYGWGRKVDQAEAVTPLDITPTRRLDDVLAYINRLPMGGTDCSAPMLYALKHGLSIDTFVVYTDNETWAGTIHPHQALRDYRSSTGIDARLVVVGMTATEFTIADPDDPGMLDVAGFDTATPNVIAAFSRGDI